MTREELEAAAAKVKPCPFCGRRGVVRAMRCGNNDELYFSVGCSGNSKECFASEVAQSTAWPLSEAVNQLAMWNRRKGR